MIKQTTITFFLAISCLLLLAQETSPENQEGLEVLTDIFESHATVLEATVVHSELTDKDRRTTYNIDHVYKGSIESETLIVVESFEKLSSQIKEYLLRTG